jgi:hypothetical protein
VPDTTIPTVAVQRISEDLSRANRSVSEQFPGDSPTRQPVHTVYGGAHLFTPRPAYRWSQRSRALINYSLKAEPHGAVQLQVLDNDGNVVRDVRSIGHAGLNRAGWDLRYESPRLIAMRTTPPENPHIWEEPRFRGQDTRPVTHWGLDAAQVGPIVVPGKYSVKLTVDGQSFTQPIEILKDPKIATSVADLDLSVKLQLRLRDDISAAADMVNAIEVMRKQLEDVAKAYKNDKSKEALLKQVTEMDKKLFDVEAKLLEPAQMTSDDKYFQQAYRVYMNLIWLNGEVGPGAGDVSGGADFPPTDTSVNVMETIEKDLNAAKADYKNLMDRDVPAFNPTPPFRLQEIRESRFKLHGRQAMAIFVGQFNLSRAMYLLPWLVESLPAKSCAPAFAKDYDFDFTRYAL